MSISPAALRLSLDRRSTHAFTLCGCFPTSGRPASSRRPALSFSFPSRRCAVKTRLIIDRATSHKWSASLRRHGTRRFRRLGNLDYYNQTKTSLRNRSASCKCLHVLLSRVPIMRQEPGSMVDTYERPLRREWASLVLVYTLHGL